MDDSASLHGNDAYARRLAVWFAKLDGLDPLKRPGQPPDQEGRVRNEQLKALRHAAYEAALRRWEAEYLQPWQQRRKHKRGAGEHSAQADGDRQHSWPANHAHADCPSPDPLSSDVEAARAVKQQAREQHKQAREQHKQAREQDKQQAREQAREQAQAERDTREIFVSVGATERRAWIAKVHESKSVDASKDGLRVEWDADARLDERCARGLADDAHVRLSSLLRGPCGGAWPKPPECLETQFRPPAWRWAHVRVHGEGATYQQDVEARALQMWHAVADRVVVVEHDDDDGGVVECYARVDPINP